jgi:hypothetical protein
VAVIQLPITENGASTQGSLPGSWPRGALVARTVQAYYAAKVASRAVAPGQIDPAVAPLRRACPHRFREVRPGHLAVVAMAGRPWFIGRVTTVTPRPHSRTPGFVQVLNVDNGEIERIPAPAIVELLSGRA